MMTAKDLRPADDHYLQRPRGSFPKADDNDASLIERSSSAPASIVALYCPAGCAWFWARADIEIGLAMSASDLFMQRGVLSSRDWCLDRFRTLLSGEIGVAVRTDAYSASTVMSRVGSSIGSMILLSTGASNARVGAFLAADFGRGFFLGALIFARTLDLDFLGAARFVAFLRAGLALALPRFELFLRAVTRFVALAMGCLL